MKRLNHRIPVVLLVENNPDDVVLTRQALIESGVAHELTVVWDGVEALEYLFATGRYQSLAELPIPDLVLLDIAMPKRDGVSVLKALRADARTRLVPVVMMTSSSQREDVLSCYGHGANSYIQKPVEFARFLTVMRVLAEYWLVFNVTVKK